MNCTRDINTMYDPGYYCGNGSSIDLSHDQSNVEWRLISNKMQVRINTANNNGSITNLFAEIWIDSGSGLQRVAGPAPAGNRNTWCHFYISWDAAKSLDGKSVIVYVNNTEVLSTTANLPEASLVSYTGPYTELYGNAIGWGGVANNVYTPNCGYISTGIFYSSQASAHSYIDNLKWFTHLVTQYGTPVGPSWEYDHSQYTIDDALHPIYGPENQYKPKLSTGNSGVGFYYVPGN
jgi:hypothetical protein